VQFDAGDWIGARATRAEAIRTADRTDDPELALLALVALDVPSVWTLHGYAEVDLDIVGRTERALAGLPETDSALRCRLLGAFAAELYDGSDDPRCDALSATAVEMARRLDDPRLLAFALNCRYQAVNQPRFAVELVAVGQELAELGAQEGMPAFELLGHQVSAMYRMMLFDVRGADAETAACDPLLRRLSLRAASVIHELWVALRLLADGRVSEAEAGYEASLAEQRQLGFFGTDALTEVIRAMLNTTAERWDAVGERLDSLALVAPLFAQSLRVWTLAGAGRRGTRDPRWRRPCRAEGLVADTGAVCGRAGRRRRRSHGSYALVLRATAAVLGVAGRRRQHHHLRSGRLLPGSPGSCPR
jgi:hypothetical protein